MAEVKLLLKTSSEQAKMKQLTADDSHLDKDQIKSYKESLTNFDSVEISEYENV
jgi:hypothetical protein